MHDFGPSIWAGLAGGALATLFFGGLWWTVRLGTSARNPAAWFLGSLLLRMGVVLAGFYLIGGRHWDRLAACLVGFVVARLIVTGMAHAP